ncbi:MAG: Ldh family oxidoreductase [Dehalococcoidia bacterium]
MVQETAADIRVSQPELLELVTAIFKSSGMTDQDAHLLADTLVTADLEGVNSHGVLRVPEYCKKLTVDGVNPAGRPGTIRDMGACMVIDGANSMGQIGMSFAMERVIERATDTGIAAAAIRGSNHSGAMSYYVRMAVEHDMIGIATTNALPTMAPIGGAERVLGINPVAYGIPAGDEHAIIYDAAFAGSAHGKLRVHAQKGLPIPEGWALDSDGQPTTDPVKAVNGLLMPIGGHKGAGMAMVMGILSSMLSGAAYGTELGNMEDGPRPGMDGHFVAAINIAAFEDINRFKSRVDKAIREIHNVKKAPGVDRTYFPGEPEAIKRKDYLANGIPLNPVTLGDIASTAKTMKVKTTKYKWLPKAP